MIVLSVMFPVSLWCEFFIHGYQFAIPIAMFALPLIPSLLEIENATIIASGLGTTHTHTRACTLQNTHTHTHTHTYSDTQMHAHTYTHTYTLTPTRTNIHTYIQQPTNTHRHTHTWETAI
jgi:hypothetical protein